MRAMFLCDISLYVRAKLAVNEPTAWPMLGYHFER
ncbi:protein of unknown function [Candidatus Nitrosacidococcus tergens]|uniref:Uncharacterized protein n=1 Tax=Candidatus Nitrosacidococcus tergens TaxID=553981 RepID=A0A7G1Q8V7_9GAMM|nr:protein of unknown function [Candidatus Nitrosacidococcus tergens]